MFFQPTDTGRRPHRRLPVALSTLVLVLLLAACGSSEPTPTPIPPAPTNTPVPAAPTAAAPAATEAPTVEATEAVTATQAESPLEVPAAEEPAAQAQSPLQTPAQAASATVSDLGLVAFVRDSILYIQDGTADATPIEDCSTGDCFIYHLDWSPAGTYLLYYRGSYDGSATQGFRIADATGTVQSVSEQPSSLQPAGWSWDGTSVVYRTDTERYAEAGDGPAQRIQELWTAAIAADGTLGEPLLHGEVTFGEGCGGGGRSESANAYEREGGFAYGYLSGIMAWTPENILLYSDNCTTHGVSRFDLTDDVALDPYPGNLRSLSLNATGDAWIAINSENQLVTGTPSSLDTTIISTNAAPELVFYGKATGTIYYTTLENTGNTDLVDQVASLDESILVSPYFDTTEASLVALGSAPGAETVLYNGDGYAYARVAESADGSVFFSRVQDSTELRDAIENGELTAENWRSYLPTVDVLILAAGSSEPEVLLADAAEYTPADP